MAPTKTTLVLAVAAISAHTAAAVTYPLPSNQWTAINKVEVDPNDDFGAGCATGNDYYFVAKRGSVNKLVVEFETGGMCYNANTCFPGKIPTLDNDGSITCSTQTLDDVANPVAGMGNLGGIQDISANSQNYFKNWNYVMIKYCTCDLNTGDQVQTMTDYSTCTFFNWGCKKTTINFRGGRNTDLVMTWAKQYYKQAFAQSSEPTKVLTTGMSAGGYSSVAYTNKISNLFPDAQHYVMSDSAGGSTDEKAIAKALGTWDAAEGVRDQGLSALISRIVSNTNSAAPDGLLVALTEYGADLNPNTMITEFSHHRDNIQNAFRCVTQKGRVTSCASEFGDNKLMPTFQQELLDHAVASQTDRCNVRWWFTEGTFHGSIQGQAGEGGGLSGAGQSWFADMGLGKNLHDLMVDLVQDVCLESASSTPFFAGAASVNKYCGAQASCSSVAARAEAAGMSVEDLKYDEALAAQDEASIDTELNNNKASGVDPVMAAALAGVGSGTVAAIASTMLVLRFNRKGNAGTTESGNPAFAMEPKSAHTIDL